MQCLRLPLPHLPRIHCKCRRMRAAGYEHTMATSQGSNEVSTIVTAAATPTREAGAQGWEVPTVAELQALLRSGSNVTCLGKTTRGLRCRRPLSSNTRNLAHLDLEAYQRSGSQVHPTSKYEKLRAVVGHCTCIHHKAMSTEILETMWREERDTWAKLEGTDRALFEKRSKSSATTTEARPTEHGCEHRAKRKPIAEDYLDCEICKLELFSNEEIEGRKHATDSSKAKIDESPWTRLAWCKAGCGRNYHAHCWTQWLAILTEKRAIPRELACPYCQARWDFSQCGCEREVKFE